MEHEILPKTAVQVAAGNKFFGAAVLDSDFNTVVADTNRETECPLYHGEIYTIQQWAAVTEKPPVQGKGPYINDVRKKRGEREGLADF